MEYFEIIINSEVRMQVERHIIHMRINIHNRIIFNLRITSFESYYLSSS